MALRLSKLTFRQYLALTLISTKYFLNETYPSLKELKETIGFKTDRMLDITLDALVKKGFLIKYDDSGYAIKEEAKKVVKELMDPLMNTTDIIEYEEIKDSIQVKNKIKIKPKIDLNLKFWLDNKEDFLKNFNDEGRIHRWYSYLEFFPPSLVLNKLKEHEIGKTHLVLEPFAGSGTTLVTCKIFGIDAIGIDVNPVATFVSKVKSNFDVDLVQFEELASRMLSRLKEATHLLKKKKLKNELLDLMGFFELHQWLKPKQQNQVWFVKKEIEQLENSPVKDLLKLALIHAAVNASNVAYCPGTSFYPFRNKPDFHDAFLKMINDILEDLLILKKTKATFGTTQVYNEDCRSASNFIEPESVDFIITSPPYPNDLEYTRQTRLELFLLGYVKNLTDVQQIKRKMVKGSTKLIFKESDSEKYVTQFESVQEVANKVESALNNKNWGWDYPRMIREYFGDMYLTLLDLKKVLKPKAHALFVVGDQTYKNHLISVGKILTEIATSLEYSSSRIELFRVRSSTIHDLDLNEEIIILKK